MSPRLVIGSMLLAATLTGCYSDHHYYQHRSHSYSQPSYRYYQPPPRPYYAPPPRPYRHHHHSRYD